MSKVKRLRKKYRAFCSNAKKTADNAAKNFEANGSTSISESRNSIKPLGKDDSKEEVNTLYDLIIDSKKSSRMDVDVRSNFSISKSIKSNLSGQSILKKDKQRLKHELFLKKLESSAELMKRLKKSKHRRKKKIDLKDDLPSLLVPENECKKSANPVSKTLHTIAKNRNFGKGLTKRRNAQMLKDIEQFQNLLKKDSTSVNSFDEIQRRIVDRLSQEALQSLNTS